MAPITVAAPAVPYNTGVAAPYNNAPVPTMYNYSNQVPQVQSYPQPGYGGGSAGAGLSSGVHHAPPVHVPSAPQV